MRTALILLLAVMALTGCASPRGRIERGWFDITGPALTCYAQARAYQLREVCHL